MVANVITMLAVVFTGLLLALAAAADAVSFSVYGLNFNKAEAVDVKARFVCSLQQNKRVIAIDKKIDSIHALQSELAHNYPGEAPHGFRVRYVLPGDHEGTWYRPVDVDVDGDVRNLMAEYDAYAKASPDPLPIQLYLKVVTTSSDQWWLCLQVFQYLLAGIGGLCCFIFFICLMVHVGGEYNREDSKTK